MNHKTLFPLRIEFHDYLEWAAARMEHLVEYGDGDGPVRTTLECMTSGELTELESDAVIFATGYRSVCPLGLLGGAGRMCATTEDGMVCIERDYRVATCCEARAGIYLQGATEHTHGIGSTLLSNTAVRAGEILDSLLGRGARAKGGGEQLVGAGRQA